MSQQAILLVLLPLIAAFALAPLRRCNPLIARVAGPAIVLTQLLLSLTLWDVVATQGSIAVTFGGFPAPVGIAFHLDMLALLFTAAIALLSLLLWPWRAPSDSAEPSLFLLLCAGASGIALSADLFNLYVFYEIVAVASYGLVASRNQAAQLFASLRFLLIGAAGSALALLGIGMLYARTGTLNLAHLGEMAAQDPTLFSSIYGLSAFTLILLGLGVKAELFPVNGWVPEVYAVCRGRISGLLAGLVSKLAMLLVMRLLVAVYAGTDAALILLVIGVLTLVFGEFAAYRATTLRRLLAFSSIGQLGLVAIAFAVNNEAGILAGVAVAFNHLLVKPALFLYSDSWRGPLDALSGRALATPLAAALFVLLVLSLVGIPPLPGFWAKYLLLKATLATGSGLYQLAVAAVLVATLVEAVYFMRLLTRLYEREGAEHTPTPAPLQQRGKLTLFGALLVLVTLSMGATLAHLQRGAHDAADQTRYRQHLLHDSVGVSLLPGATTEGSR